MARSTANALKAIEKRRKEEKIDSGVRRTDIVRQDTTKVGGASAKIVLSSKNALDTIQKRRAVAGEEGQSRANYSSAPNSSQKYTDYSSAVKYLQDRGVQGASGIMTENEWRRRNKSGGTYQEYLDSTVSKYENGTHSETIKTKQPNKKESDASGWEITKNAILSGMTSFDKGLMATLDFILPTELLGEKYDFVSKANDYYTELDNYYKQQKAKSLHGKSTATKIAADIGEGTVAALPNAILALMSGGTSAAGTALGQSASAGTSLLSTLGNSARATMKNPMYWTSFAQTVGTDYEEAKANGANEYVAGVTAIIKSGLNAGIEVGGGIETLPDNLKSGDTKRIMNWVKSSLEEGNEEVVQGIVSATIDKLTYDRDKEVVSLSDENAIINPQRMAKEFGMGTAVGGVLGGAQIGAIKGVNAIANASRGKTTQTPTTQPAEKQITTPDTHEQAVKDVSENRSRSTPLHERLEALSQNNESITAEDVKKATGFGEEGAKLVAEIANREGTTFSQAERMVKNAYLAGFANVEGSKVHFETDTQIDAFTAGKKDRAMQDLSAKEKADNAVVHTESGFIAENLPGDVKQSQVDTLDLMAKALGVKSYVAKGLKGNAELNRATGEVPIDYDFERTIGTDGNRQEASIVFHAAHEMAVHRVVELAPEEGSAFVYEMYKHLAGNEPSVFTLADEKRQTYAKQDVEISLAEAMEEVSANNILYLYNNDEAKFHNAIDSIVNGTNEKAKQGLRKYIDYLNKIIKKIRNFLTGKTTQERTEIQAELDEITMLRDMFETAFAKAVESKKSKEINSAKNLDIKVNEDYNGNVNYSIKAQRGRSIEIETMENNRFERLRQFYDNLPSEWYAFTRDYFYIYSNQSYTEYTILTKVRITNSIRQDIFDFTEELEDGIDRGTKAFDKWAASFRRGKGRNSWHSISTHKTRTTGQNDGVDVRPSRSDNDTDTKRSGKHSESEVKNYSLKAKDQEYLELAKDPKKNEARLREMVDEAAKEAGYNSPKLYHGTRAFGFTEFDISKSDDNRTIFLTSNERIASTYSGVSGERKISDVYNKDIESLSIDDVAKELNKFVKEHYKDTFESADYNYSHYNLEKLNKLISTVNDGLVELRTEVEQKIVEYADKMALDFDDTTAKTHRQLVSLKEKLDKWDYHNLSTPIYLLIHHTEAFADNSAKYADLEANIRLMNMLRAHQDITEGVVAEESLGRYSIEVMSKSEAAEKLKSLSQKGNYALYAKMENPLVIDGKGKNWNEIHNWTNALVPSLAELKLLKEGDSYQLVNNKTGANIQGAVVPITPAIEKESKERVISFLRTEALHRFAIKYEGKKSTREIAKIAKNMGYDSVLIKNITDNGGQNFNVGMEETADIYILFDSNNAKSADPVTYDDKGNEIPLSERFSNSEDIRFSLKGTNNTTSDGAKKLSVPERLAKYVEDGAIPTDLYDELIEKYGIIPSGERPHREVQVPRKTGKDKKVSQTIRAGAEKNASDTDMFREGENTDKLAMWTTKRVGDKVKPKSISEIVATIEHEFGINITTGHVRGKGVLGQYTKDNRGIRTKIANNLPVISHELGHYFERTLAIKEQLTEELQKELTLNLDKRIAENYPKNKLIREGVAEYVRRFLQNRETTAINYPLFTDFFLKQFSGKDLAMLEQLADDINAYYSLDVDTATSSIRLREESAIDLRTPMEKLKEKANSLYQAFFDSNHSIKRFDRATGSNAYVLASNAAYSDAIAGQILSGDLTDINGRYVSCGLKAVLHGIDLNNKEEYRLFGEYLAVKHGPERLQEGMRVFADDRKNSTNWMENRQAQLEAQHPQFKEASERLYAFIKQFYKTWGVDTGLISETTLDSWSERWEFYVPFNRVMEKGKGSAGAKKGFANQNSTIKKARGSGRDIYNPVDNLIDNIVRLVNAGVRNNVMLNITNAAEKLGADATFLEKVPMPTSVTKMDITGVKDTLTSWLEESNLDTKSKEEASGIVKNLDDVLFQYGRGKASGNVVTVLKNGTPQAWKINDAELLQSLTSLSPKTMDGILDAYAVVSRFMTSNITGNNLVWSIFSNLPRDMAAFFTYSKNKNVIKMANGVGSAYINKVKGDKADPLYKEYLAMGGGQVNVYNADRNLAKKTRKSLSDRKFNPNPLSWIDFVSNTVEAGPRFATYKMMREAGMTPQEAFYEAMDITVNFRRGGRIARELNKVVPFFNANMQGLDKFRRWITAEEVKGADRKKTVRNRAVSFVAVNAALAAISYALNNSDDEKKKEYEQLSTYTKNSYWVIPMGNGKYFAIPKPREIAVLSSFFETCMEYGIGENEHAFDEFYAYASENFLPAIANDIAQVGSKGAVETAANIIGSFGLFGVFSYLGANRDFLGRPIVSSGLQNLEKKDQYTDRTSKIAYWLGQAFNGSPQQIDYFCQQILGGWWKGQKALFPVGEKNVDWTLGVGNTYIKDNQYSTDLTNWLYDRADMTGKSKNSNPDDINKAIVAKWDSNMIDFYQTYYKKAKEDSKTTAARSTRQLVLDMIREYQKGIDGDYKTSLQEAVEKVCVVKGSIEYLPSVMSAEVTDGNDKKHTLSDVQYVEYQTDYLRLYWETVEETMSANMTTSEKSNILIAAKRVAKEQATERTLKRIGAPSSEFATKYKGVENDTLTEFLAGVSESNEDNSLKKEEVVNVISGLDVDNDDAWTLYLSKYDSVSAKYAHDMGIDGKVYMNFLETLKDVDRPTESGIYGTYTQDEATNAVRQLEGLSQQEKAILWQSVNTKWKKNPFR